MHINHINTDLTKKERRTLTRLMTPLVLGEGRLVITQGAVGREFMMLLDGEAVVERDGEEVCERASGDFFGEIALLGRLWGTDYHRTASVRLTSESELGVFNRREFRAAMDEIPVLRHMVLEQASALGVDEPGAFEQTL